MLTSIVSFILPVLSNPCYVPGSVLGIMVNSTDVVRTFVAHTVSGGDANRGSQ